MTQSSQPSAGYTPSGSSTFLNESFTGNDVTAKRWLYGNNGLGDAYPCLTARSSGSAPVGGLTGTGTVAFDPIGQGALRLTGSHTDQVGYVIYDQALSAKQGLTVKFDMYQYGGDGGDGLSFFLLDGNKTPTKAGAWGGALGYAASAEKGAAGLDGAYVGIGFDAYGNFSNPHDNSIGGPGLTPDSIAIRGSQANAYKYLTGTGSLCAGIDAPCATDRNDAKRSVLIDLSSTGLLDVFIDLNADGDFLDADEKAIENFNLIGANGALPDNLKFGFAAATGCATNIHEIKNLHVAAGPKLETPPLPGPSPSPSPSPNPGPSPLPGPSPSPNPGPSPLPGPSPSPNPGPSPLPGPGPSPLPGPSPSPGPSPLPGPGPSPGPSPLPGPSPSPGPSPLPGPGPSPNPGPGPSPGPSPTNVDPIFVVPGSPRIVTGVSGAVIGAVDVIDPDTTGYVFRVLNGTTNAIDNRFIVSNGQLRLVDGQSIAAGTGNFNLIIEIVDGQGNAFRSDRLNITTQSSTVQIGGSNSVVTYSEGAPAVQISRDLTLVGDSANQQLNEASVTIANFRSGQDILTVGNNPSQRTGTINGLNWNYNDATGVFTLTGNGSVADYQTALRQVSYFNSSNNPDSVGRTINFTIGGGANPLGLGSVVIDVVGSDTPPTFFVPGAAQVSAGVSGAVVGAFNLVDPDTTGYTFTILNGTQSTGTNRVVDARFVIDNGQIRLANGQSLAAGTGPISLIVEARSGGQIFRSDAFNLNVSSGGIQIGGGAGLVTYTEGAAPTAIAGDLTIAGGTAGQQIASATVSIGSNFTTGQDILTIGADPAVRTGTVNGLTWNYNATTGVFTLSGNGTVDAYQAALRQVAYFNSSNNPRTVGRTITYNLNGAGGAGGGVTSLGSGSVVVGVTGVDTPGVFQIPAGLTLRTGVAGAAVTGAAGAGAPIITVVDPDSTYTYTIGGNFGTQFELVNGSLRLRPGQSLTQAGTLVIPIIATNTATGATLTQDVTITVAAGPGLTAVPQADLLFLEPSTGAIVNWTMNNVSEVAAANVLRRPDGSAIAAPAGWRIVSTADFDGNGVADLLWQSNTGAVGIWSLGPNGVVQNARFVQLNGADAALGGFSIAGAADMNGDGRTDLVLRNGAQDITQIWLLDGNSTILNGSAGQVTVLNPATGGALAAGAGFQIVGLGDFNGDGQTDILYDSPTLRATAPETIAATGVWVMNGTTFSNVYSLPRIAANYEVRATGDFNGDRRQDIIWRDNRYNAGVDSTLLWTSGVTSTGVVTATQTPVSVGAGVTAGWQVYGAGDFNADGTADIVFRNPTTNQNAIWLMRNGQVSQPLFVTDPVTPGTPSVPKTNNPINWQIIGVNEFGSPAVV
jgi:hypothetical protein